MLRPPKRVGVVLSAAGDPTHVKVGDYYEPVNTIEQWRVDERWWHTPVDRSYVKVVGPSWLVLIFQDLFTGDWFLERIFD